MCEMPTYLPPVPNLTGPFCSGNETKNSPPLHLALLLLPLLLSLLIRWC